MKDRMSDPKWSLEQEETWKCFAISLAIIALVGFCVASAWVIVAPTNTEKLLRVQIVAPFGIFVGAIITFCTVVWRGMIATRQADTGLQQLDGLRQQIVSTEENNLATLLQKGAELVADAEKPSHMAAGIAMLQAVATTPTKKFSSEAMDLIVDFIQEHASQVLDSDAFKIGVQALTSGAANGALSSRTLTLETTDNLHRWEVIKGVKYLILHGGMFKDQSIREFKDQSIYFENVTIRGCEIRIGFFMYKTCRFEFCKILSASPAAMKGHAFQYCNFSNAEIDRFPPFPDLRLGGNFYDPTRPPRSKRKLDWSSVLHAGDPEVEVTDYSRP